MNRNSARRIRQTSRRQEKRAAEDVGGHTQAGSGNARLGGGADVRKNGELRVECKYTEQDFYVLKLSELKKLQMQAIKGGLEAPVLQFAFKNRSAGGFTSSYAVEPSSGKRPSDFVITASGNSTRIYKDYLQKILLENDKVVVAFGNKGSYDVMLWGNYLERMSRMAEET